MASDWALVLLVRFVSYQRLALEERRMLTELIEEPMWGWETVAPA
jgi:hypothetical protein